MELIYFLSFVGLVAIIGSIWGYIELKKEEREDALT